MKASAAELKVRMVADLGAEALVFQAFRASDLRGVGLRRHDGETRVVVGFRKVDLGRALGRDGQGRNRHVDGFREKRGNERVKTHRDDFDLAVHPLSDLSDEVHVETFIPTALGIKIFKRRIGRERTHAQHLLGGGLGNVYGFGERVLRFGGEGRKQGADDDGGDGCDGSKLFGVSHDEGPRYNGRIVQPVLVPLGIVHMLCGFDKRKPRRGDSHTAGPSSGGRSVQCRTQAASNGTSSADCLCTETGSSVSGRLGRAEALPNSFPRPGFDARPGPQRLHGRFERIHPTSVFAQSDRRIRSFS